MQYLPGVTGFGLIRFSTWQQLVDTTLARGDVSLLINTILHESMKSVGQNGHLNTTSCLPLDKVTLCPQPILRSTALAQTVKNFPQTAAAVSRPSNSANSLG